MKIFDFFVCAVPDKNREEFTKMCEVSTDVHLEHGGTRVVYSWGEEIPAGEMTSFPMAVKCEKGESVVIGWHEWSSSEARDAAMPKIREVMSDMYKDAASMPFDSTRMIIGKFGAFIDR